MLFVPLQEQFAENADKSSDVCKVIVALHIYHKFLVSGTQDLLQKKKKMALIKF